MYKISFYTSPITIPLFFAVHSWIVLETPEKGIRRYEIHVWKNKETGNYFYINNKPEKTGMNLFAVGDLWYSKQTFKSTSIAFFEGEEYKEMIEKVENAVLYEYPYKNVYRLFPGPNSNTFTQWVIEKAGLAKLVQLPWNAFGKKF